MIFCVAFFPEASHVMVACTTLKLGKKEEEEEEKILCC